MFCRSSPDAEQVTERVGKELGVKTKVSDYIRPTFSGFKLTYIGVRRTNVTYLTRSWCSKP